MNHRNRIDHAAAMAAIVGIATKAAMHHPEIAAILSIGPDEQDLLAALDAGTDDAAPYYVCMMNGAPVLAFKEIGISAMLARDTGEHGVALYLGGDGVRLAGFTMSPDKAYAIAEWLMNAADAAVQAMVEADLERDR